MLSPGHVFAGRYEMVGRLGSGGAGAVYQATDTRLQRNVALKLLTASGASVPERFLREARTIAALSHPNIVNIYDIGESDGQSYIAQELLVGRPLSAVLAGGERVPLPAALEILSQIASALAYAHGRGVIHRDVKPGNIFLVESGSAKLLDFGIAKLSGASNLTVADAGLVGTVAYAAPEQIQGGPVDGRADIYSLGAVAFEMISGRKLFEGDSVVEIISRRMTAHAPRLREVMPECPAAVDAFVAKCMALRVSDRHSSMTEVNDDLRSLVAEIGGLADRPAQIRALARVGPAATPLAPAVPPVETSGPQQWDAGNPVVTPRDGTMLGPVLNPDATVVIRPDATPIGVLAPGTKVGRFTLHELVAQGQTGHLYKAFDPVRSRLVGVKVIQNPTSIAVQRLLRAARIWIDLRHPNLQTILDVDPGGGGAPALIVTELIEGVNLRRLLERRRLDLLQRIEVALQVCEALDYMHARGVIHREIKPGNIILSASDLRVTVLDSGLARSMDAKEQLLTSIGAPVGDLRYMAPEQAHGMSDQRSDVYSLGVVLYEMCMEERFDAARIPAMLERLGQAEHLPRPLVAALRGALHEERQRRFSTIHELADSLRALVPEKLRPVNLTQVVVTLHGIRTHARWQRAFSEVASRAALQCRLDRWNFGYFSVVRFLVPWSRDAKVTWFRTTYHDEFGERATSPLSTERPSIVAHSFGTYILGNALLRYPYLRFNKVLLCGSILPEDFPWDVLIDRGQVQAVRNEYGARDFWTQLAQKFVPGTGPTGLRGFSCQHERLEQEKFDFTHSEYFERGHMEEKWLPFIKRRLGFITPRERTATSPSGALPIALYALYAAAAFVVIVAIGWAL